MKKIPTEKTQLRSSFGNIKVKKEKVFFFFFPGMRMITRWKKHITTQKPRKHTKIFIKPDKQKIMQTLWNLTWANMNRKSNKNLKDHCRYLMSIYFFNLTRFSSAYNCLHITLSCSVKVDGKVGGLDIVRVD